MEFHRDELHQALRPGYLQQGQDLLNSGQVLSAQALDQGKLVAGMVRDGPKDSKQLIQVGRRPDGSLEITGQCSCRIGYNCAHVAAVMLQLTEHRPRSDELKELQQELRYWLDRLKTVEASADRKAPADCLLYLLDLETRFSGRFLSLCTVKARRLRHGGYGSQSPFTQGSRSSARFLRPSDQLILRQLEACDSNQPGCYELHGAPGAALLQHLLDSGRCFWGAKPDTPLMLGAALESPLAWELEDDGSQSVHADASPPDTLLLPLAPPWYYDPRFFSCGPVETGLPAPVAETLAAAPPVALDQAELLARALENQFPDRDLPTPREPGITRREDIVPVPCLRLNSRKDSLYRPGDPAWDDFALLSFDYAGMSVHPWDEEQALMLRREQDLELVLRHDDIEQQRLRELQALGLEVDDTLAEDDEDGLPLTHSGGDAGWRDLVREQLPELARNGWRIEAASGFRFQRPKTERWYGRLDETPGADWFKLELGVELNGEQINLLPPLADFLFQQDGELAWRQLRRQNDRRPLWLTLDDGRQLTLPLGRVRRIIDTLAELFEPNLLDAAGRLRLPRLSSPQLLQLGSRVKWHGGAELRRYARLLDERDAIPRQSVPKGLNADLRPYQRGGLDWLQFLRSQGLGGILADDMGLGKTLQVLAHLLTEKLAGRCDKPSLVIAPTSLLPNWRRELARFAPQLSLLVLHGKQRLEDFPRIPQFDLVLTSYALLGRDLEQLQSHDYHLLILDEAQHIKNPRAKTSRSAMRLNADQRLCLSGTPMENHLGELWSQFHFLMPGLLGEEKHFRRLFRQPIEEHGDDSRRQALRRRIAPFVLRREKAQVAADLPPKSEIITEVELIGAQRDLYESLRVGTRKSLFAEIDKRGLKRSRIQILDALLKLRQACCDPRLLKLDSAARVKSSAKLDLLTEILPEMVAEGRRILLFSQFTSMLALIEQRLEKLGLTHVKLTGRSRDRDTPVQVFQRGEAPLFLISLKAGGTGLNLTAADTVIHYDPWWNPAAEQQASDRAHRIGQDKPVFIYKLIAHGTVEEKILALQQRKQALLQKLFDGRGATQLDEETLDNLFSPLE